MWALPRYSHHIRRFKCHMQPTWFGGPLPCTHRQYILPAAPQAVFAHELGHLKCEHGIWLTMANVIGNGAGVRMYAVLS